MSQQETAASCNRQTKQHNRTFHWGFHLQIPHATLHSQLSACYSPRPRLKTQYRVCKFRSFSSLALRRWHTCGSGNDKGTAFALMTSQVNLRKRQWMYLCNHFGICNNCLTSRWQVTVNVPSTKTQSIA